MFIFLLFGFVSSVVWASDGFSFYAVFKELPGFIKNTTSWLKSDVIDRVRDSREKEVFRRSLSGGYTIYLDEVENNRMSVRPTCVPYQIRVERAVFRSRDGRSEEENATRLAASLFDRELEHEELVRKRKFARNEFGVVDDPAKGGKKVLDIFYRCDNHRGEVVKAGKRASAHEMSHIKLTCADVPSFFAGQFGSNGGDSA